MKNINRVLASIIMYIFLSFGLVACDLFFPTEEFTLTINCDSDEGKVVQSPEGTTFIKGEEIRLESISNEGYDFDHWEGAIGGSSNPITIVMDSDKLIIPVFKKEKRTLSTSAIGEGSIVLSPTSGEGLSQGEYYFGDEVSVTASPNSGQSFIQWGGDATGTQETISIIMTENKHVIASFDANVYEVSITSNCGYAEFSVTSNSSRDLPGFFFDHGDEVTITASSTSDIYEFDDWDGDIVSINNPLEFTITSNVNLVANYNLSLDDMPDDAGNLVIVNTFNGDFILYANGQPVRVIPALSSQFLVEIPNPDQIRLHLELYKFEEVSDFANPESTALYLNWDVVLSNTNSLSQRRTWVVDDGTNYAGPQTGTLRLYYFPGSNYEYSVDVLLGSQTRSLVAQMDPGMPVRVIGMEFNVYTLLYRYMWSDPQSVDDIQVIGWQTTEIMPDGSEEAIYIVFNQFNAEEDRVIPHFGGVISSPYCEVALKNISTLPVIFYINGDMIENSPLSYLGDGNTQYASIIPGNGAVQSYTLECSDEPYFVEIVDLNGNTIQSFDLTTINDGQYLYEVGSNDVDAPEVIGVNPSSGANGVPINSSIVLEFSETMVDRVTEFSFTLREENTNELVDVDFVWNSNFTTMTINPQDLLANGTDYLINLSDLAVDKAGNQLTTGFVSTFRTEW